jgi:hypothetical protein
MKTLNRIFVLIFLISGVVRVSAQTTEDAEVPGDNFSLEGALELFKKSASPEEFEKKLNSADSKVNNLDLNNDGRIDYVKVIDKNEGNIHAFILQAVISDTESQDVAVIELEKLEDGKAVLQITGDADVYGIETIIEPTDEVRVNAGATTERVVVNVWAWPSVQYVYGPYYNPWISPWGWAYNPFWWRPWTPVAYYVYGPWWRPYRPYYSVCYSHRIGFFPRYYNSYRTRSTVVYHNHRHQIDRYRSSRRDGDRWSRNDNSRGRDRYDGYGNRSRSDYNSHEGRQATRRLEANAGTRERSYTSDRSLSGRGRTLEANRSSTNRSSRDNDISDRSRSNSRTIERSDRNTQRSSPEYRSTPERSQRSNDFKQRAPEQNNSNRQFRQPKESRSFSPENRQQRSSSPSPSYRSGGGNRSGSTGGSGGGGGSRGSNGGGRQSGSGNNSRGRH